MNKSVFISLIFILGSTYLLNAQENIIPAIKWYSIEEAEKMSEKEPRKILVDVYTDWCGWCKKMDKQTFGHPVIANYINQNYYPVKLNAESTKEIVFRGHTYKYVENGKRGYHELAAGLLNGRLSYPSIVYLNEELELLGAVPGYRGPEDIEPLLNYIVENKYEKQSLEEYQKDFTSKLLDRP